jgi:molybdate transport system substrate-binding protein
MLCLLCAAAVPDDVRAEEVTLAVAANFLIASRALKREFEASTGHRVNVTSGSTGQLYAQIVNGAPYDIFLAADQERPHLVAASGLGDAASVFTYAIGQLALWSGDPDRIHDGQMMAALQSDFRWFAIPEPDLAPYGAAARQALEKLGVWEELEPRIVKGQNVAQTFAMIETGNAQLGLVALSQALVYQGPASFRAVPAALYDPIRQDAILLSRAKDNDAARQFLEFLKMPAAAAIMQRFGYAQPGSYD